MPAGPALRTDGDFRWRPLPGPRRPWQILEGESKAFTGVIEFPDAEAAQRWYDSPAYQEIVPLRVRNTKGRILIFEGVQAA